MELRTITLDAHSQKGVGRASNQDAIGTLCWTSDQGKPDTIRSTMTQNDNPHLFLLADGVGGHEYGAIASRQTIETIVHQFSGDAENFNIAAGINAAHTTLNLKPTISHRQMATTIVGLVLSRNTALIFNIGDSRAYALGNKELKLLSIDDVDETKPKNVITQCIGGGKKLPKPHFLRYQNTLSETFILLSDGVTDYLTEDKIFDIISSVATNKSLLICSEAIRAGSDDDVSAMIITR